MLAVTKVLLDDPLPPLGEAVTHARSTAKTISDVRRAHAPHWKCFQIDRTLVTPAPTPYRAPITAPQRKRKRKNSDGEYTPHQKVENNPSITHTVRRTSKRLAICVKLEQQPIAITTTSTRPHWSTFTGRSSSSTSALTSTSSSSFDRLPTPKGLDTSDLSVAAPKSKPKKSPPKRLPTPETNWWEEDDPSEWRYRIFPPVKIGFPSKEKKIANDRNCPTSTSYRLIEVSDRLHPTPYL